MHQTSKGNKWYLEIKCHIVAAADSCLGHTVVGTSANLKIGARAFVPRQETYVSADAAHQCAEKRDNTQDIHTRWRIVLRLGLCSLLDTNDPNAVLAPQILQVKARMRDKGKYPLQVIRRQFGHLRARYWGPASNTAQLHTLFALLRCRTCGWRPDE